MSENNLSDLEIINNLLLVQYVTRTLGPTILNYKPISAGRVDRASATETVDSGSIPNWAKPKTITIGIHSLLV